MEKYIRRRRVTVYSIIRMGQRLCIIFPNLIYQLNILNQAGWLLFSQVLKTPHLWYTFS
jgi:hypothetical protein